MLVKERKIEILTLENGKSPFENWHDELSIDLQHAVVARITRLSNGNFGDHKSIGGGVFEIRINKGPGLRVYYGLKDKDVVVLINGGHKKTQKSDIKTSKDLWFKYEK